MSHDTWIHRVARVGVRPLVATRIAPNHITTLRLASGLAAAALLAVGNDTAAFWAAWLFLASMVLDRADGELARMSARTSAGGHTYDLVVDALCNALVFVGLGIGLRTGAQGWPAIPMGLVAGVAVACVLWLVLRAEAERGQRAGELGSHAGFDADDAMLIVPVAIFLGAREPLLVAACVGAPVFALLFFWYLRKKHPSLLTK